MPAGVHDYDAIANGLRKLRGENPTGRYFAPGTDGKFVDLSHGHDMDWATGRCLRCQASRELQLDFPFFAQCPGSWPAAGTVIGGTRHIEFRASKQPGECYAKQLTPDGCECEGCESRRRIATTSLAQMVVAAVPNALQTHLGTDLPDNLGKD